jgi:hypothetical protein
MIWGRQEVVGVRSGTLLGESQGGHSGHYDFFGNECETDSQTIRDESTEGKDFADRIKKGEKGGREYREKERTCP